MDTVTHAERRIERDELARRGAVAVVGTLVAMALVRGLAGLVVPLADIEPMAWPAVLGSAAVAAIAGTLVFALLTRVVDRPTRVFVGLAVVGLLVSLVPLATFAPTLPGVTTGVLGVMGAMHVVAAVVVVGALTR